MHSIPIYIYRYFSHRSSAATAPTNLWKPMISIYAKAPVITENKQSHLLISFIFLNSQDVSLMFLCVLKRAVSHGPTVFCLLQDAPRCPKAGIGSLINSLPPLPTAHAGCFCQRQSHERGGRLESGNVTGKDPKRTQSRLNRGSSALINNQIGAPTQQVHQKRRQKC